MNDCWGKCCGDNDKPPRNKTEITAKYYTTLRGGIYEQQLWRQHRSDVAQQSRLPPGSASVPRYGSDSLQLGGLGVPVDIWDRSHAQSIISPAQLMSLNLCVILCLCW